MNREILESQFPTHQIKTRQGNFGNTLAYLEAHTAIQRLNNALESAWSFEVLSHDILKDEVLVLGKLTAGNDIVKTQFGTSSITRNKTTGEIVSLGDDLKAAATDALKKAATLLGVGLSLYAGNNDTAPHLPYNGKQGIPVSNTHQPHTNYSSNINGGFDTGQKGPGENQPGQNRLSSKQLGYLNNIAKDQAITQQELNNMAIQKFGTQLSFLSKKDASLFINELISAQNAA
jgi:hypothetical protein